MRATRRDRRRVTTDPAEVLARLPLLDRLGLTAVTLKSLRPSSLRCVTGVGALARASLETPQSGIARLCAGHLGSRTLVGGIPDTVLGRTRRTAPISHGENLHRRAAVSLKLHTFRVDGHCGLCPRATQAQSPSVARRPASSTVQTASRCRRSGACSWTIMSPSGSPPVAATTRSSASTTVAPKRAAASRRAASQASCSASPSERV